jgi:hypothetical protein
MITIPKVYLPENKKATLNYPGLQGFPLFGYESHLLNPVEKSHCKIYDLIDWLNVEKSVRYKPTEYGTQCDAYVTDFCACRDVYLAGGVWWKPEYITEHEKNESLPWECIYGKTVYELSANALYSWLLNYGKYYGWVAAESLTQLQVYANKGATCIISGKNKTGKPGHVVVVLPECEKRAAVAVRNKEGFVVYPVTSEAGGLNRKISISDRWFLSKDFTVKFWINEGESK